MKTKLVIAASLSASLLTSAVEARECRSVNAVGNVKETVECPANQEFDYCIVRSILIDRGGLLTGRLEFFEDFSQGSEHPKAPSMNLYVGRVKIITDNGGLDLIERGIFDTASLEFAGLATIEEAKGELAGFTGTVADLGNSEGTILITGTICKE